MLAPTLGRVEACEEDQIGRREEEKRDLLGVY